MSRGKKDDLPRVATVARYEVACGITLYFGAKDIYKYFFCAG